MSFKMPSIPILQPLPPSRPASYYQISYTKYHQNKLAQKLSQNRSNELLLQIDQLKNQRINEKKNKNVESEQKNEKILLLSIQNNRIRTIMQQQGETIQNMRNDWNSLENIYNLKFQQLKHNLSNEFHDQISSRKQQALRQVQKIKDLYIQKISVLTKESFQKSSQQQKIIQQQKQKLLAFNLLQLKQKQCQIKIKSLGQIIERKNQEIQEIKSNNRNFKDYQQNQKYQINKQFLQLSNKNNNLVQMNQRLNQQIQKIKQTIIFNQQTSNNQFFQLNQTLDKIKEQNQKLKYNKKHLQERILQLEQLILSMQNDYFLIKQQNKKLQSQQGQLRAKYQKLEQKLEQFKNRKTQQNLINHMIQNIATGKKNIHNQKNDVLDQSQQRNQTQRQNTIIGTPTQIRISQGQKINYQKNIKKIHQLQIKIHDLKEQLTMKDHLIDKKYDQISELNRKIQNLQKIIQDKQLIEDQNNKSLEQLKLQIQNLRLKLKKLDKQLSSAQNKSNQLQKIVQQKQKQGQILHITIKSLEQKLQKLSIQLNQPKLKSSMEISNELNELNKNLQKLQSLQSIIKQFSQEWGQKQKNQNAIFREIQINYYQQIKMIKLKSQENQKLISSYSDIVADMAKQKNQLDSSIKSKSKSKKKQ